MKTLATPAMDALAAGFAGSFRSAVCSGICGDEAHQKRGGYHIGRSFQSVTNYSVVRPDDRPGHGPNDAAAAVDMSMSRADMILCTRRLIVLFTNVNDPRRKYVNAFNGWLGTGDAQRYDIVARKVSRASNDHQWHIHLEVRRAYVLNGVAMKAILSALHGQSIAQYLISIGVVPRNPSAKPATPPYPGRILVPTSSTHPDPAVKAWQTVMLARGWKSLGRADGQFGPKLTSVVQRYQSICKVRPDGHIGPQTWPLPWTRPLG